MVPNRVLPRLFFRAESFSGRGRGAVEWEIVALLAAVAAVAGFVDAIAGGGGLLTLPALMMAGLSPVAAIATNKLQGTFGVAASSLAFWRAGLIDLRELATAVGATAVGAAVGSLAVRGLDLDWLNRAVPMILILVAGYFAFARRLGESATRAARLGPLGFALGAAFPVGAYDGFLGPGAGSMYLLGFVALRGLGLLEATAGTKVLNLTSNAVALAIFSASGDIDYRAGLAMAAGQVVGSRAGARTALARGAGLIRPLVVIVSIAVAVSLLLKG